MPYHVCGGEREGTQGETQKADSQWILWILESLGLASSQISSGHPPGVRGCLGLLGCNWICPAAVCPKQAHLRQP